RVAESAIRDELLTALDYWAGLVDGKLRERLLAVALGADRDPLKERLRDPKRWADLKELKVLAKRVDAKQLTPSLLVDLGLLLQEQEEGVDLLRRAQQHHLDDFWLTFDLGSVLRKHGRLDEAIGYYRAALALRPRAVAAHNNLGAALMDKGLPDAAIAAYH